ncbi:MAG: hypothetical protein ACJ74T_09825 [Pyrinomonadaceae bacterium]
MDRLRLEVEAIKQQKESEAKGFIGWTKRWGGILGLIALLFSVPKGAIDLYKAVRDLDKRPNTQMYDAAYIEWSYVPQQKLLTLSFPFTLINRGDDDDLLQTLNAKVETASLNSRTITEFDYTDFKCSATENPQPLPMPLHLAVKESISKKCSMSATLGDEAARIVEGTIKASDPLRLTVLAVGENEVKHELKMCFNPDEDLRGNVADPRCFDGEGK